MLEPIIDPIVAGEALERGRLATTGAYDVSRDWLRAKARFALAEESANHLDADQCNRLEEALRKCGVTRLVAVATETLKNTILAYELDATAADLTEFSWTCGGLNYVLLSKDGPELAVLCTVDDYLLVAGPQEFVETYAGDLRAARRKFLEFLEWSIPEARPPALVRAADYMSWITDEPETGER